MVDIVRPKYLNYSREEKNEFNMEAKRSFKLFLDTEKENVEGSTPQNKRQRRSQSQNKCRVSSEKLDVFKMVTNQILQEKQSGLRSAWENIYKQVVNTFVVEDANEVDTHKPEDFLLELGELDNDWKTSSSLEHTRRRSADEFNDDGTGQQLEAV